MSAASMSAASASPWLPSAAPCSMRPHGQLPHPGARRIARASPRPSRGSAGDRAGGPPHTGRRGCVRRARRRGPPAAWSVSGRRASTPTARSRSPAASATRASPRAEIPSQHGSPIWQARANDCSRHAAAPASSPAASSASPSIACGHGRKDSQCSRSASSMAAPSCPVGHVQVAAQQADPSQHRQRVDLEARFARGPRCLDGLLQQGDGAAGSRRDRWRPSRGRSSPSP